MDAQKMYKFKKRKNKAGNIMNTLSLIFNLTATPTNIIKVKPPDAIGKMKLYTNPTSKPKAPKICKIEEIIPNRLNPKRINSFFIFEDVK